MSGARVYRNGVLERADLPLGEVVQACDDPEVIVWVDLVDDEASVLHDLGPRLHLDTLAVEDALHGQQRPKVNRYPAHLFVSVQAALVEDGDLRLSEVDIFATRRALVTVRGRAVDPAPWTRAWEGMPDLLKEGVGALLHGVLDAVVDTHLAAVLVLDERVDDVEGELFEGRPGLMVETQRDLHALRRSLVRERLALLPMRQVLLDLDRGEADDWVVTPALRTYYRDVYDHVIHAVDVAEGLRDTLTAVFETSLALQDHQLNTVMKKLSAWAAIIAVPTAVTGWYGQNLPYPGFAQDWGFFSSLVIIAALVVGLYLSFKRRGWL